MTNYFQDRLDELSKATLTRTADAAKERGKMAQIASDTSDREEDKEWHQKHADRFKRVGDKAIAKASTKNEETSKPIEDTVKRLTGKDGIVAKVRAAKDKERQKQSERSQGTPHMSESAKKDEWIVSHRSDPGKEPVETFATGHTIDDAHKDAQSRHSAFKDIPKNKLVFQRGGKVVEEVELDENYKKHSTLANIYDKEIGHFKDAAHRKGMATSAIQAHTRSLNTAPNDAKKEYHKKRIDQYKTILKESEELSEVSDAKKREYLDAAVDSHHQGFTGRTPMSKDKMDKRRAMIQKVAQKVTGQKHYSDMDGKQYNASTGKKYNEEVELDESFTDAQIAKLKSSYAGISTIDPDSDGYRKLTALLDKQDVATLKKLADAKIKFVSGLALNRYNRKKPKNEGVELDEKTLTPAELKKREEVAKAMEKDQPGIDKSKKMAIATSVAKRVAESQSLEEATFIDDTHPHYEKMMKEFGAKVAKIKPNEKAHVGNFSHGNNVYQSTMASKTKTGKVRFWHTKD